MDLPHEDPEPQLTVRPKKARRTKTEENTGTHPGKRGNSLQKGLSKVTPGIPQLHEEIQFTLCENVYIFICLLVYPNIL